MIFLYGKIDFVEVFESLAIYRSENNLLDQSNYVECSNCWNVKFFCSIVDSYIIILMVL